MSTTLITRRAESSLGKYEEDRKMADKKDIKKEVPETKAEPLHLIYVGDTILELGLLQSTVYINSLPKQIEEKFEEVPQLKKLFAPVDNASQALLDARTEGTAIYALNKIVKEKFRELRKKGDK